MYCSSCGSNVPDGQKFCSSCGAPVSEAEFAYQQQANNYYRQPSNYYQQPVAPVRESSSVNIPSVGSFMGWMLLFCIPLVGFIMAIVFACDKTNKVRQNFSKAMLFWTLIAVLIVLIPVLLGVAGIFSLGYFY